MGLFSRQGLARIAFKQYVYIQHVYLLGGQFFPSLSWSLQWQAELQCKIDHFDTTEDWESCEESHSSANEAKLSLSGDLDTPLDLVIGVGVKIDMDQLQGCIFLLPGRDILTLAKLPCSFDDHLTWVKLNILNKVFLVLVVLLKQLSKLHSVFSRFFLNLSKRLIDSLDVSIQTPRGKIRFLKGSEVKLVKGCRGTGGAVGRHRSNLSITVMCIH